MAEDPDPLDALAKEVVEDGKILDENELWWWNRKVFTAVRAGDVRYPAICAYRPPGWNVFNALYLRVTAVREREQEIDVDFGDYFDFEMENSLDKVGVVLNGKARYCRYRERGVHYEFNIQLLHPLELNDKSRFSWMLKAAGGSGAREADFWRIYDRNQFVFWNSYGKRAERKYVDPIKQSLTSAAFVAWLHQPLLRRMRLQRSKLKYYQAELVEKNPVDTLRYFDEDEDHAFAPVPAGSVPPSPAGNADVEIILKRYRALIEASLWCFYSVMTSEMRDQNKAMRSAPEQQETEEDDANTNDEYLNDDRPNSFPLVEGGWFYNWSGVKGVFDTRRLFAAAVYGEISKRDNQLNLITKKNNTLKDFFIDERYPLGDSLSHIFESKCLIRAQINTMQSYIGTRVHMRAVLRLVGGADEIAFAESEEVQNEERVRVRTGGAALWCRVSDSDAYFPGTNANQFISNLRTDEFPESAYFRDRPVAQTPAGAVVPDEPSRDSQKFIRKDVRDFMMGEGDTSLEASSFTSVLERDMADEFSKCKEVLDEARGGGWKTKDLQIIGTEVPVYNPYCMFKSARDSDHGKYRFFCSQADFVALATSEAVDGTHPKMIVMGEIKVLMERNSPIERIKDPRTMSQSVTNAVLFQMQTGIEVGAVMHVHLSRRKNPEVSYVTCVYLRLPANIVDIKRSVGITLRPQKTKDNAGVAYCDGKSMCVFEKGEMKKPPGVDLKALELLQVPLQENNQWYNQINPSRVATEPWLRWRGENDQKIVNVSHMFQNTSFACVRDDDDDQNPLQLESHTSESEGQLTPRTLRRMRRDLVREEGRRERGGGGGDGEGGGGGGNLNDDLDRESNAGSEPPEEPPEEPPPAPLAPPAQDNEQQAQQPQQQGLQGLRASFRQTPSTLERNARMYPPNEPEDAKNRRLALRDVVRAAAETILATPPVGPIYDRVCAELRVRAFRTWGRRLKNMRVFSEMPVYRRILADGVNTRRVYSGNRMTPELMNEEPTPAKFIQDPRGTLKQLVIRALHRYVNDTAFRTIDLVGTPENDPNAHGVGGEVLTKREMSRKFIHNSQRAYWDGRVSDWASNVAVPAAMNAVTVALTTGRAIV